MKCCSDDSKSNSEAKSDACCSVESLITIDERGQMVLPKEIRVKAGIKPGDKLLVACIEKEGKVCCITLMKTEAINDVVQRLMAHAVKADFNK